MFFQIFSGPVRRRSVVVELAALDPEVRARLNLGAWQLLDVVPGPGQLAGRFVLSLDGEFVSIGVSRAGSFGLSPRPGLGIRRPGRVRPARARRGGRWSGQLR